MTEALRTLETHIAGSLSEKLISSKIAINELTIEVAPVDLLSTAIFLRDDESCCFEQLIDLCGVDYLAYGRRYASVIHLLSIKHNHRIRLKTYCDDNEFPIVDSVTDIWNSANWFEREAFDLFGIMYSGHPDLRRILTDYGFSGHPFRKDFPLIGQVEMRYDEEQ
ncbi:UNVERIFIED_CONTAM: hypothetical protein GTU68_053426, partial [Idotea baltica]|nr:hypothetical protein [Idotea baltica]